MITCFVMLHLYQSETLPLFEPTINYNEQVQDHHELPYSTPAIAQRNLNLTFQSMPGSISEKEQAFLILMQHKLLDNNKQFQQRIKQLRDLYQSGLEATQKGIASTLYWMYISLSVPTAGANLLEYGFDQEVSTVFDVNNGHFSSFLNEPLTIGIYIATLALGTFGYFATRHSCRELETKITEILSNLDALSAKLDKQINLLTTHFNLIARRHQLLKTCNQLQQNITCSPLEALTLKNNQASLREITDNLEAYATQHNSLYPLVNNATTSAKPVTSSAIDNIGKQAEDSGLFMRKVKDSITIGLFLVGTLVGYALLDTLTMGAITVTACALIVGYKIYQNRKEKRMDADHQQSKQQNQEVKQANEKLESLNQRLIEGNEHLDAFLEQQQTPSNRNRRH